MKTCKKKTKKAMKTIGHRIRTDNEYARGWHRRIAKASVESGVSWHQADKAASEIMLQVFNAQNYSKTDEMAAYEAKMSELMGVLV